MRIRAKTIKDRWASRIAITVGLVKEAMLFTGEAVAPTEAIASWSEEERNAVLDYLAAVHFIASDNPGKLPARPACLDAWKPKR